MVEITESEAKTYELIKSGLNPDEITKQTGMRRKSVIEHLNSLWKNGLINKHGNQKAGYTYSHNNKPYGILERSTEYQRKRKREVEVDAMTQTKVIVKLTPDEERKVAALKGKPRSFISKQTGIPKWKLNFYLERKRSS